MKKILFILTLLFSTLSYAQSDSEQLTTLLLNIHTMQANFTQTIQDKHAKSLQQSKGRVALERPGKFRWEVKQPIAQLIIANGSRLWIYDPDLEQVIIRSFHKATSQTPALLLSDNNLTLGKDFTVKLAMNPSHIAGEQIFLLTPKNQDDMFAQIKLIFIAKKIHQMQLADKLGHQTTITFGNVETGQVLPASLFTFKPSPQIDIIDETKHAK